MTGVFSVGVGMIAGVVVAVVTHQGCGSPLADEPCTWSAQQARLPPAGRGRPPEAAARRPALKGEWRKL
jgi:hypothetical protein